MPTVALVGYTNAGKTTLFNALTGGDAVASDALFVTLDPLGSGDWFEMMERNLHALANALGAPEPTP